MQINKRLNSFIRKQIKELRERGLSALFRKMRTFLSITLPAALSIPLVFIVRALRPLVLIRFGALSSVRIGHYAINTELYLCKRDIQMHGKRIFDIFYNATAYPYPAFWVSNRQLRKMWARTLHVSHAARWLDMANHWLPGGEEHTIQLPSERDVEGQCRLDSTEPHLTFTAEEEKKGRDALRKLGIPEGAPFVCFHSRDSAYLNDIAPQKNWLYHDYRDTNIQDYVPAIEELTRRGYYAIRMGAIVKEALKTTNPKIIDYAVNGRTDFLDIYLPAKCRFFIGDTAGIGIVAIIFRRPLARAGFIPLEYLPTWSKADLSIVKKLWLRKKRRFMTFREILDSGVGRFLETQQYEEAGIQPVENTPEEITALALEMDARLKGTWQRTEEDERLQQRFWALFKPSDLNQVFLSHVGAEFLRQNQELLK